MLRLRVGASLLLPLPIAALRFQRELARLISPFWSALSRSFAHARRHRLNARPITAAALALITLIGLIVRLQFIHQPMRDDESTTTMLYAMKPLYIGLSIYVKPNNHLFHTLLVHIFTRFFGAAEWAIRTPAMVAGLMLVPLTYELVRRFTSVTGALWAAALLSASSIMVEYSTNARGYTIICCAAAVTLIAADEMLRVASPRWFAVFALAAFIGCWTIPLFLIPLGGTAVWAGWQSAHRSRRFRRIFWTRLLIAGAIAMIAVAVVYLPPIATSGLNGLLNDAYVTPHNFRSFLMYNGIGFERTWALWTRDLPTWWSLAMPVAFFAGLVLCPRLRTLIVCIASWTAFLFIARRYVTLERTWLVFMPLVLGSAAAAPAYLFGRFVPTRLRLPAGAIAAVAIAGALSIPVARNRSILASKETGPFRSASEIVRYLETENIPPELVFRDPDYDFPLQYYYWRRHRTDALQPSLKSILERHASEGWLLVNTDIGETFPEMVRKFGLQGVRVMDQQPFNGCTLYHLAWTGLLGNPA